MPHSTPLLLQRVLSLPSATPRSDQFGLTLIPLGLPTIPARSPPELTYSELDPPAPGALLVSNRGGHPGLVHLGAVIVDGMADRTVTATVTIPSGITELVPVEPLSPRWWMGRQPHATRQLSASLTALVILATRAHPGLRSVARTALWEGYRRSTDRPAEELGSWLLIRDRAVLAARLVVRHAEPDRAPSVRQAVAAGTGGVIATAAQGHGDLVYLCIVSAALDLPDAIVSSAPV